MNSRIGVVIVTHNSSGVIDACLETVNHMPVTVVDNASEDQTVEQVRRHSEVRLIANPQNRGFAAAVNQGVRATNSEFVLLMNPDVTLVTPVDPLAAACKEPGIGMASGQLLDVSGRTQTGFTLRSLPGPAALMFEVLGLNRLFPWNPVNRKYRCLGMDLTRPANVEQPPGAFLMFRRDLWDRLGGLDERFFPIWFEDVDLCERTLNLGFKIRYVPAVRAVHQGGHSIGQIGWAKREQYWYVSLLRYAGKHFSSSMFRAMGLTVILGAAARAATKVVQLRSFEACAVYAGIIRMAAASAFYGEMPNPAQPGILVESSRLRKNNQVKARR